jgi:hypothetical protein
MDSRTMHYTIYVHNETYTTWSAAFTVSRGASMTSGKEIRYRRIREGTKDFSKELPSRDTCLKCEVTWPFDLLHNPWREEK